MLHVSIKLIIALRFNAKAQNRACLFDLLRSREQHKELMI